MKAKIKKIGIIGCGAIGSRLALYIDNKLVQFAKVTSLSDIDREKAKNLSFKIKSHPEVLSSESLIKKCDLIIECASAAVSFRIVKRSLKSNKDVLVLSVGGLIRNELFSLLSKSSARLYIPSGAIAGIDAIKAAYLHDLRKITLTTYKPLRGLAGSLGKARITREKVIFEGNVKAAIKKYPKNINVAATLALVVRDFNKVKVKIVTGPKIKRNSHKIFVESKAVDLHTQTFNIPCPDNPKTSLLAVLSAQRLLEDIFGNLKIGS